MEKPIKKLCQVIRKKNSYKDELKSLCDVATKVAKHQIRTDRLRTAEQKSQDIEFLLVQGTKRVSHFWHQRFKI